MCRQKSYARGADALAAQDDLRPGQEHGEGQYQPGSVGDAVAFQKPRGDLPFPYCVCVGIMVQTSRRGL